MRSETRKLLGAAVALVVTIPPPQSLAGQDTQGVQEDCEPALALSGASAHDILSRFSKCSRSPEDLGPGRRASLDALADRLVTLAIADPDSEATLATLIEMRVSGRVDQPGGYVRYPGAWDALRRMYLGGAAMLYDLIAVDPKRTIDWGLRLVEVGGLEEAEACEILGHALQHGEIRTGDGEMSFELAATTNNVYEKGVWGFKGMQQELAAELHAKGLIRTEEAPCQGFAYTHAVPYEIIEMVPPDSVPDAGKRKGSSQK